MSVIQHESFENGLEESWSTYQDTPASVAFVSHDEENAPEKGGGSYCFRARVVAANPHAYGLTEATPTTSAFYYRTWARLVDHALEDTEQAVSIAGVFTAASTLACRFYPYKAGGVSGTVYIMFSFWDGAAARNHLMGEMVADTWYRLEAHIDGINGTWECRIDGVMSSAGTIGSFTRAGNRMFAGIYNAGNDLCVDVDAMEWRDEYWPGVGIPAVSATDVMNLVETPVKDGTKTMLDTFLIGDADPAFDIRKRVSEAVVLGETVVKEGTKSIIDTANLAETVVKGGTKSIIDTANLAETVVKGGTKAILDVAYASEAYTPKRIVTRSLSDTIQVVESGTITFWKTVSGGVWKPMKYVVDLFVGYLNNDWTVRSAVTSVWNTVSDKVTSWTENS